MAIEHIVIAKIKILCYNKKEMFNCNIVVLSDKFMSVIENI